MRIVVGLATLILASALVSDCGGHARAMHVANPQAAALRAVDMPRGYVEGDDTVCGLATTENSDSPLAKLFFAERPQGCVIDLERVWAGGTGPSSSSSAATTFPA